MDYESRIQTLVDSYGDWWNKGFETPKMSKDLYPYDNMFTPIKVNRLTLKNRLVMAPMGNISMCDETGRPSPKMLKYFEERARGGVGLITSGLIPVSYGIDKSLIELGDLTYFPRIDRSRTVFSAWRDLAAMCHAHGANFFIQLTPGLGRVGNPQCLVNQFSFPRSASFNPNWYMKDVPCLRLSDHSLRKIIKRIGQGSADAKAANIDGVYLHGHEGYLLEQVTNPAFNRRKMGRYANFMMFGIDMIKEIRRRVGPDYPIMYRIDLSLALNATYGEKMDTVNPLKKFKDERTAKQTLKYMAELVKAGVDIFDVDLGCYDNWWLPHPPSSMPAGCFLEISEIVKKFFKENDIKSNKGLEVPVVGVGKLGYPDLAEKALRDNKCDMVMLGRPLLADPDWCNKAYAGKVADIRPCIGCQEACINEFVEGGHPQCAVNPRTAFEEEYSREIPKAAQVKKCAVIGAGPAGVTAAEALIARGHKVDLYEKAEIIGGNLIPAAKGKIKYEVKNYLDYLAGVVEKLKKNTSFKLFLGTAATAAALKEKGYDVILTATGSSQCKPPEKFVPGINSENVLFAVDVINNPDLVKDAQKIVVIGGGIVGAETAYMLRYEMNKDVKVVEMQKYFMNHACTANRGHIIRYLEKGGVELINCAMLKKIEGNKVYIAKNVHKRVPDPYNTWAPILPENVENPMDLLKPFGEVIEERILEADKVLLAMGVSPKSALYTELVSEHAAPEIYNVGDSFRGARIFEAVRGAYRKAVSI
ncbi:MAG: FAD-dependent oxidoreductase [Christensenellales bacterium]|jgi:2-enoate reductase|nr:FAD-dependent oxidoreductase [Eubacteriales bacterium]